MLRRRPIVCLGSARSSKVDERVQSSDHDKHRDATEDDLRSPTCSKGMPDADRVLANVFDDLRLLLHLSGGAVNACFKAGTLGGPHHTGRLEASLPQRTARSATSTTAIPHVTPCRSPASRDYRVHRELTKAGNAIALDSQSPISDY